MPLTGFPNLYELARDFRMDVLTLAQKLQPYAKNRQLQVKPYEQTQIHSDAPTVACIDDSDSVQRNVKRVLETAGYQVVSLTEPARALTTLVRKKPVLILMDITMPEMNGYDLSRMLRQSASLKEVPIVMLTGRDGVVDRLRARMVGANDYITKPFNPHQLIQLVQQLTRQPQAVLK
jgi:twitching motility two-component system response regulator PilG